MGGTDRGFAINAVEPDDERDQQDDSFLLREIRFALVMTGGVSLAVWMGGAAFEFFRLIRAREDEGADIYRELLEITRSHATIDILSGTSAGGLNGVLMAAALLADAPIDRFEKLRDTWLDVGDINRLFRSHKDRRATSLLRGEEYFLPRVEAALQILVGAREQTLGDRRSQPLDLVVPATTLSPRISVLTDTFRERFTEVDYRAQFTFGWGADAVHPTPGGDVIKKLARAARTSASFPFAFEPSFVNAVSGANPLGGNVSVNRDQFMVDGGILDNKPIEHALSILAQRPAKGTVRRVIAYFAPRVRQEQSGDTRDESAPPMLSEVVAASLLTIPANESIAADIDRLKRHNEKIVEQQGRRRLIIQASQSPAGDRSESKADVEQLAIQLLSQQTNLHAYAAARILVRRLDDVPDDRVSAGQREALVDALTKGRSGLLERGINQPEQIPTDAEQSQVGSLGVGTAWPTESMDELASATEELVEASDDRAARIRLLTKADDAVSRENKADEDRWPWGLYAVRNASEVATSLVRRSMSVLDPESDIDLFRALAAIKQTLHLVRRQTFHMKSMDKVYWDGRFAGFAADPPEDLLSWVTESYEKWPEIPEMGEGRLTQQSEMWRRAFSELFEKRQDSDSSSTIHDMALDKLESLAFCTAALLWRALPLCQRAVDAADPAAPDLGGVRSELDYFAGGPPAELIPPPDAIRTTLKRLVSLFVVQTALGVLTVAEHPADFLIVSADVDSPLADGKQAADKLAGMQLANFAGFVKRSWRANDWMWGRLDAADRIAQVLVDPGRLPTDPDKRKEAFQRLAHLIGDLVPTRVLDDARREFMDPVSPSDMPATRRFVSEGIQRKIASQELPRVADAIVDSAKVESAALDAGAQRFVRAVKNTELPNLGREAGKLINSLQVGQESWQGEAGSDHFTRVTGQVAMVASHIAMNPESGVGALGRLVNKVHVFIAAFYFTAMLAIRRSKTTFALALFAIVVAALTLTFEYVLTDAAAGAEALNPPDLLVFAAWVVAVPVAATLLLSRYGFVAFAVLLFGGLFIASIWSDTKVLADKLAWCCAADPAVTRWEIAASAAVLAVGWVVMGQLTRAREAFLVGALLGGWGGILLHWWWVPDLAPIGFGFVLGGIVGMQVGDRKPTSGVRRSIKWGLAAVVASLLLVLALGFVAPRLLNDQHWIATGFAHFSDNRLAWTITLTPAIAVLIALTRFSPTAMKLDAG